MGLTALWLAGLGVAGATDLVVILPGLGDSPSNREHMAAWGEQVAPQGYEVVVPDYIDHDSFDGTVANVEAFFEALDPAAYDEIHVFSYIVGAWALNTWLQDHELPGLATLVYDRSPLQERVPWAATERLPCIVRWRAGAVVEQLGARPYPPLKVPDGVEVGLIIENEATKLFRMFKRKALSLGPVSWEPADLGQVHHDHLFVPLDHDEMYTSFALTGPELIHFFEHGVFSSEGAREPAPGDPLDR